MNRRANQVAIIRFHRRHRIRFPPHRMSLVVFPLTTSAIKNPLGWYSQDQSSGSLCHQTRICRLVLHCLDRQDLSLDPHRPRTRCSFGRARPLKWTSSLLPSPLPPQRRLPLVLLVHHFPRAVLLGRQGRPIPKTAMEHQRLINPLILLVGCAKAHRTVFSGSRRSSLDKLKKKIIISPGIVHDVSHLC